MNCATIWHSVTRNAPDGDGEAEFGKLDLDIDQPDPDFADEGMGAPVAALRRIPEREEEALVAARQRLQPQVASGRKIERIARDVAGLAAGRRRLHQAFRAERSVTRGATAVGAARRSGSATASSRAIAGSSRRWV